MRLRNAAALAAGAFVLAAPVAGSAHFILIQPPSAIVENQLGDPQKLGPCGGTTKDAGTPTGVVTPVTGGELALGTWQSVALVDLNLDNPDRQVRLSFLA